VPPKILSDDQLKKHDIDTLKRFIRHKPGGYRVAYRVSLSVSEKRISGRGNVDGAPRPEKFFGSRLTIFRPALKGRVAVLPHLAELADEIAMTR